MSLISHYFGQVEKNTFKVMCDNPLNKKIIMKCDETILHAPLCFPKNSLQLKSQIRRSDTIKVMRKNFMSTDCLIFILKFLLF